MQIRDAIQQVKNLKPNQYGDEVLVGWLSDLDGLIYQDVLCHYSDAPAPEPYTTENMDTELLVEKPHEELYVAYLSAKIDYQNGEYERYNNAMMAFNAGMEAYVNVYNRTHMPRQDAYIGI